MVAARLPELWEWAEYYCPWCYIAVVRLNKVMPIESLFLLFKSDSTHGIWHEDMSLDGSILRVGE